MPKLAKAVWKLISLLLALGTFLVVGVGQVLAGEDLLWLVIKAIGAFFASWMFLGLLGELLGSLLDNKTGEDSLTDA